MFALGRRFAALGALAVVCAAAAVSSAVAARPRAVVPPSTISLTASAKQVRGGHSVLLSGRVSDPLLRRGVSLSASPYPYRAARQVAQTTAGADGTFSFRVVPRFNTRYRAVLTGTSAQAQAAVLVVYPVKIRVRALPLGRARVSIIISHPHGVNWGRALVHWSFALGHHGRFFREPSTRTRESRRGVTVLGTTVSLPAGHFRFKLCFAAPLTGAIFNVHRPAGCRGRGYAGSGSLPFGFPSPRAVAAAAAYLSGRAGRTAFAVIDSQGRLSGVHVHWTFVSASVVKAMLLVAYLRKLHSHGQHYVDGYSDSILYPMIHVSDNGAATAVYNHIGDGGLYALAARAGMTDYNVYGGWATSQISAADQARFFFEMDSLIPREFVGYARRLLSTIVGYESWGIPAVARGHRYAVFFKGGWRGTALGQLVHQVARLERPDHSFSMAVMTDGDPSMGYGIQTIEGLTSALLRAR